MQNSEQANPSSLWSAINERANIKTIDELYKLYSEDQFNNVIVDPTTDPELYNFVEETKTKPRFNDYQKEQLANFVSRIYELRKN